jgi:hypothetical protein
MAKTKTAAAEETFEPLPEAAPEAAPEAVPVPAGGNEPGVPGPSDITRASAQPVAPEVTED